MCYTLFDIMMAENCLLSRGKLTLCLRKDFNFLKLCNVSSKQHNQVKMENSANDAKATTRANEYDFYFQSFQDLI